MPGLAAVIVSVIHIFKGECVGKKSLDGKEVNLISAFLFHAGGNNNPKMLLANTDKSFKGSDIGGIGFTFDDNILGATPIAEMQKLITKNPNNGEIIFPYIGGEEVNSSPTHKYHRYVINFGNMSESEARKYPDLMNIIEDKVKPQRMLLRNTSDGIKLKKNWWQFSRIRPGLYQTISQFDRILFHPFISKYMSFTFLPTRIIYASPHIVFANEQNSFFCILQSRIHEIWTRFFSSSMKDDLLYAPSDCFETFPFPKTGKPTPP